jgi:hypothetical protein
MRTPLQVWRDWRWRKSQTPREGWLYLWDVYGELVAKRPTTLVPTRDGRFANAEEMIFHATRGPVHIAAMTLVDADGNETEIPLRQD